MQKSTAYINYNKSCNTGKKNKIMVTLLTRNDPHYNKMYCKINITGNLSSCLPFKFREETKLL